MSKMMDELMAELERVNALKTEVERTVANHTEQIKADRDSRMERPRAFIISMGWKLAKLSDESKSVHFLDIPLNVYVQGTELVINYNIEKNAYGKFTLYAYGGYPRQIEFRVNSKGILPDYDYQIQFVNAIIDQWDDECEQKFEQNVANIIKKKLAERMETMEKKLADSNEEYEMYFGKSGE